MGPVVLGATWPRQGTKCLSLGCDGEGESRAALPHPTPWLGGAVPLCHPMPC